MPRVSPDPVQSELPVTPAVEQPALNFPYDEPGHLQGELAYFLLDARFLVCAAGLALRMATQ